MTMQGTPGPVAQNVAHTSKQGAVRIRTGLIRMPVDTMHLIQLEGGAVHCTARSYQDHATAKVVYFCQHRGCSGRTWSTHEAMRAAHPDRVQMEKRGEAHVYGMWSADIYDPEALVTARKALADAEAYAKETEKSKSKSRDDRDTHREALAELEKARVAVTAAGACIGLIAPPEPRFDEA